MRRSILKSQDTVLGSLTSLVVMLLSARRHVSDVYCYYRLESNVESLFIAFRHDSH